MAGKEKPPSVPKERGSTVRDALREQLSAGWASARELSTLAGVREKDVIEHLEHLEKSAKARGERLRVEPARCLACEYVFRDRRKLTAPSACPECRSERVAPPRFQLESKGSR